MDPLGQLYLTCTILGWGFIFACFALGQIDHNGAGHDGGHLGHDGTAGHIGAGGDHGAGAHGAGHHGLARGVAHSAHGAHGLDAHGMHHGGDGTVGHGAGGHGQAQGHGHGHVDSGDDAHTSVQPVMRSRDNKLYFTLVSIFSPMSLSLFAGFFGSVGFILWHYLPWLGYLTLIPAIGCSLVATEFLKRAMSTVVSKLSASSLTKKAEAIGRIAEVHTPIKDGRLGEVTYVIGSTRFNSSAKSANGEDFPRGSKVMIVETEGPVVYVEPAKDIDLELY